MDLERDPTEVSLNGFIRAAAGLVARAVGNLPVGVQVPYACGLRCRERVSLNIDIGRVSAGTPLAATTADLKLDNFGLG